MRDFNPAPSQVSSGALDLAKTNLEQMLRLCAAPVAPAAPSGPGAPAGPDGGPGIAAELAAAQAKSLHDVIHELVRQVTSPNTLVREQVSGVESQRSHPSTN